MLHDATKLTPIPYPIPAADAATLGPPLSTHSSTSFAPFDCRHHSHQDRPWDKAHSLLALVAGEAVISPTRVVPHAIRNEVTPAGCVRYEQRPEGVSVCEECSRWH